MQGDPTPGKMRASRYAFGENFKLPSVPVSSPRSEAKKMSQNS